MPDTPPNGNALLNAIYAFGGVVAGLLGRESWKRTRGNGKIHETKLCHVVEAIERLEESVRVEASKTRAVANAIAQEQTHKLDRIADHTSRLVGRGDG